MGRDSRETDHLLTELQSNYTNSICCTTC